MDDNKKFCPNCSQPYFLNLISSKQKSNLPLFLSCGHSMCENCILNIIKCMEPIECKVCKIDVEFKTNDAMLVVQHPTKLYDFFPVNVYMVGEISVNLMKKPECNQKSHDHFAELKAVVKNEPMKGQCLECTAATTKMCQQCATILCDNCFNKSHSSFVIFKNHELQDIELTKIPNYCNVHNEKPLEYYCHDCAKAICMDCMMVGGEKSCKNHNVVSMQEVNGTFLEDLKEMSPQIDEVYRRLTKTAVDIGYLLLNYENDTGSATELINILAKLDQHFSKLFSVIQKHKNEILKIILDLKCSEKDSLQKAKIETVNAIKKAKNILKLIKAASDPLQLKQANLPVLLMDAKQIVNSPWYLNKDDSNKDALNITVNEDLCALINDYIHLEGNVKSVYKLYSTSELGEDVEIPPPPKAPVLPPELPKDVRETSKKKEKSIPKSEPRGLYTNVPRYRSKSGSVSSITSNGSDSSTMSYITQNDNYQEPLVQQVSPFPGSQPQQLREGSQELIYISHIVDPHNFFVQRACHQSQVKEMLREFRNAVSFTKPSTNHITIGKTYLAFNKTDNMWQRCRVIGIDKSDANKQPLIEVFCFDFGSIETVSIDKLRLIPAQRIQCPYPLAINCSLANCEPKSGSWTSDDSFLVQNIIDNKQAIIYIRRIVATSSLDFKLECDVTTFEHGVSLAHALVFHERAKMPNPKLRNPTLARLNEKPKLYMSHNDFKADINEPVYITHVVSPDKFYVRKQQQQAVYDKLCEDIDQEYNLNSNSGNVYLPELGMACAVNVSKQRAGAGQASWARGVVTALAGRGRVRVLLPDAGLELLLHWTALRHLTPRFTNVRALAMECHLAGITPLNKQWSSGSVALLKRYEGSLLNLQVEDFRNRSHHNRSSAGVTLYDNTDPDNIVCINQEMIKHKYAITFGVYMYNNKTIDQQVVINKSPCEQPKFNTQNNKITILKKRDDKNVNEADLQAKDKGPLRLEAKVLHYQSPSLIYISLVHQQKTFNELFDKMQKYYSKSKEPTKTDWQVGNRCCTICSQSQTWRRAVITAIENENAKVFYSDFACTETVPLASLRELTEEFASFGDAAILCHLCGIVPAVGDEWPSLTKEFLNELLDAYKRVFITKLGNFKNKSMPVQIWVYHTIQGDALEPNKSEWRCLNNKIVEQGLGVPDKSQIVATPENCDTDKGDMLSFLNITGSVNDWLQLEPSAPLVPVPKKPDLASHRDSPSSSEIEETSKTEEGSSNVQYISDWLPPDPWQHKEFTGCPTYIDNDGIIYIHDITQQDNLDIIRKALDVRFKNPDPKAKYTKWSVGEPCVALYFLDNKYYRGRVMEVDMENSSCLIHYVDYGNEELCSFENLRKSVPLHQIPVQAHKCILNRIRPINKKWDQQTLDYIHKSVVEKNCFIKVCGQPVNGIIPIELKYNKLCINDHLVDFEMAEYTDGTKAPIKKFAPARKEKYEENTTDAIDSGPDYIVVDETDSAEQAPDELFDFKSLKGRDWNNIMAEDPKSTDSNYFTYPRFPEEEFTCNIAVINDIHTVELNVLYDEETTRVYEQMYEELQAQCQDLSPLNGIFQNKACVAIFPNDGQWYRASILEYSKAKSVIKVRYVDYGNIEIIPLSDTREILEEWTTLPPVTITAKLYGVKVNPDMNINDIAKEYSKIFIDQGSFQAEVISYEDSYPQVELRNDKKELIYNSLIENNILIPKV